MTTTLISTQALAAGVPSACAAVPVAVAPFATASFAALPASARLRSAALMPSAADISAADISVVDVPASEVSWLRGRSFYGTTSSAVTANAQAAKHGKAVGPPRGTSV